MTVKQRKIKQILSAGELSHEELADIFFACGHCGKVTQEEYEEIAAAVREMHRDGLVKYTPDRKVALTETAFD